MKRELTTSFRLWLGSVFVCCILYTALILLVGHFFAPYTADGSLIIVDGRIVGSEQIAQGFTAPRYIWPRPSAVDYDAAEAGGSNLSPANEELNFRALRILNALDVDSTERIPADLVAASGSGLDPHITADAARLQAPRVAHARGMSVGVVEAIIDQHAFFPSGITFGSRIVNVLALNLALDRRRPN